MEEQNESQEELEMEIGNKEIESKHLEPKPVKIVSVKIVNVDKANAKKLNCEVKHPDKEETITISTVSFLRDDKVVTKGLWIQHDVEDEKKLQKGSALANFLVSRNAKTIKELQNQEVETKLDGNYLAFKSY